MLLVRLLDWCWILCSWGLLGGVILPAPSRSGVGAGQRKPEKQQAPLQTPNKQEQDWVTRARNGDRAACEALVLKYGASFRGYFAYTRRFGLVEADDLVQEAWLQIWRSLEHFRGDSSFRTWAMVICHRVATDAIRKRVRRPHEEPIEEQSSLSQENMTDEMLQLKQKSLQMRQLFSALHEKAQEILDLFYLQELSPKEISELLSIPEGTVKSRLADARKQLRRAWQRAHGARELEGSHGRQ